MPFCGVVTINCKRTFKTTKKIIKYFQLVTLKLLLFVAHITMITFATGKNAFDA